MNSAGVLVRQGGGFAVGPDAAARPYGRGRAAYGGAVHGGAVHGGAVHGGAVHGGAVHGGAATAALPTSLMAASGRAGGRRVETGLAGRPIPAVDRLLGQGVRRPFALRVHPVGMLAMWRRWSLTRKILTAVIGGGLSLFLLCCGLGQLLYATGPETAEPEDGSTRAPIVPLVASVAPSVSASPSPSAVVVSSAAAAAVVTTTAPARGDPDPNPQPKPKDGPKPSPKRTTPGPAPKPPADVYYKNCAAVRAAGAAPIRRGDPGYASHLDRDGDGVGCEAS
jgi:hypothetical protein